MALFKISKGASGGLSNQALGDGYCWFTYDDGKFYIDYKDPTDNVVKRKALNADNADNDHLGNLINSSYAANLTFDNSTYVLTLLAKSGATLATVNLIDYELTGALNGNTYTYTLTPFQDGTALTSAATSATIPSMSAATGSTAGTAGLVPAPQAGAQDKFLRGDGTWVDLFSEYDAMVFKGIVIQDSDLPASGYSAGWTYRAAADGIYKGEYCEVGDLIIAVKDYDSSTASNADWTKIEHNIDGALFMGHAGSALSDGTKLLNVTGGGIVTTSSSTVGSLTKPVFLNAGTLTEITHSLNATVNSGTANQVAYYSDANTIDSMAPAWQPWTAGSTNGPQANIQIGNAIYQSAAIPSATATDSGIVTTAAQTFAGDKTFQGNIFPAVSDSYNLGSTALRWKFLYGVRGIDLTNTGATGITVNNTDIVHSSSYKVDATGLAGIYDDSHSFWVLSTDQPYGDTWLKSKANRNIIFERNGTENARFDTTGHFIPGTTETFNLGSTTKYWNNAYIKNIIYSSGEANRLVWTDSDKLLKATNHYADATSIAINSTTIPTPPTGYPTYNLYINGDARSSGDLYFEGTNNKLAAFKLTTVGTVSRANIDMGWDWEKLDGAGAAFRSTDPNLAANQIGRFVLFARTTADDTAQLVGAPTGELSWKKVSGAARIGINADANANYNLYVNGTSLLNDVVRIGAASKKGGLRIYGEFDYSETGEAFDTNDRPSLTMSGNYPQIWLMSNANNSSHGATITLGGMATAGATSGSMQAFTIESSGAYAPTNLTIGYGTNANPHYNTGISSGYGTLIMRLTSAGRVGILTASPSYPLHVTGDMYTSGWARAASGFYCHDTGVHYTHNGNHGEINITKSNEMIISGNANTLYINYRAATRGTLITTFRFHGGSSTSYSQLITGHIIPGADNTYTLGSTSSLAWSYVCARNHTLYAGSAWYGDFHINRLGTANSGDGNATRGVQGVTLLRVGNNVAWPAAGTAGGANNSTGIVRIYAENTYFTDIMSQTGSANRTFYLPNYNANMVAVHTGNNNAVGSATVPVYVAANGRVTQCSYALNSTVNAGTANYMTYYSGANAISATSGARISTNTNLSIWPSGSSPNYSHGIRIHSLSSWSGILFCGDDCTADTGTSANSWWVGNNNGTFYINKNAGTAAANTRAMATSTGWTFGNTSRNSYALNCASFICDSWVRTYGSAGWYSESYGGGWYMSDSTWIRTYGSKNVYQNTGIIRTDGQFQVGGDGSKFYANSSGNGFFSNILGVGAVNTSFRLTVQAPANTAANFYLKSSTSGQWSYIRIHNNAQYWDIGSNSSAVGSIPAGALKFGYNGANDGVWITTAKVLFGAAWNDYAEFRKTEEKIEPGRCVKENGDDTLSLTTKRLERGCEIVSDTYGFAIGQTEECQTPTAASGRVLAYLYEGQEIAKTHIGYPVCSGPNGTVSIMTEEEEEKYPSRIIGTISAVPDYEIWHGAQDVKVNGRVWIRIR